MGEASPFVPADRPQWRRWLPVAMHVGAFAGAVLFYGLAGLLFAFWAEALAVSVAWIARTLRQGFSPQVALALFSLFFLFVHLQFITFIAAAESGDRFALLDPGFAWGAQWPALAWGLASGIAYGLVAKRGEPLPSPMRKVILLHVSLVLGGVLSGFLFAFGAGVILVGAFLTALRVADDLLPPGSFWPRGLPAPVWPSLGRR